MIKAYNFKIKPNDKQQALLSQFFGCTRFIYNWGLERKTSAYKENGSSLTYMQLAKDLTNLKKEEDYKWLNTCTIWISHIKNVYLITYENSKNKYIRHRNDGK